MTGHNWGTIGKRYEVLLPWLAHRSDLNYLIGEMIAELSTSHTYVSGGDQPKTPQIGVGLLGVDFEPDGGYYRIARIYPGENWNRDYPFPAYRARSESESRRLFNRRQRTTCHYVPGCLRILSELAEKMSL